MTAAINNFKQNKQNAPHTHIHKWAKIISLKNYAYIIETKNQKPTKAD